MEKTKELWKCLKKRGIHTTEELQKEIKKLAPVDISLMAGGYNAAQNIKSEKRKAV